MSVVSFVGDENRGGLIICFLRDPFTVSSRGGRQLKKRFVADSDARDVKRERNGKWKDFLLFRKVDVVEYLSKFKLLIINKTAHSLIPSSV